MPLRFFDRLGRRLAGRFWTPERSRRRPEDFWMAHPAVRRAVNRAVSGDGATWPMEWFQARFGGRPFDRVLVPGCGTGELERDLLAKGLCRRIDAFDVAASAVEAARRQAEAAGLGERVTYRVCAFEDLDPDVPYDACFFHHSLHHLRRPEEALDRVARWLVPAGLLYLDEYVGPSRGRWNRRSFAAATAVYRRIPRRLRTRDELEIPGLLAKLSDPSESIASHRILPAVEARFAILERRDYGGFLLQPVWGQIVHDEELVADLIAIERALARLHPTWFSVVVARAR